MILHIPHASRTVPAEVRQQFLLDDAALDHELTRMTDAFTDVLFEYPSAVRVEAEVSRLVVDVERFRDDESEPMSAVGMGAVYERTSGGKLLRAPVGREVREQLLGRYYGPHHRRLEAVLAAQLSGMGQVLIVDCHSFPSQALPCDRDQTMPRPDFCIGTDRFHTDMDLVGRLGNLLGEQGFSVGIDWPYSGAIVPMSAYHQDPRVKAVMIEVSRKLYTDEATGEKSSSFEAIRRVVVELLRLCGEK